MGTGNLHPSPVNLVEQGKLLGASDSDAQLSKWARKSLDHAGCTQPSFKKKSKRDSFWRRSVICLLHDESIQLIVVLLAVIVLTLLAQPKTLISVCSISCDRAND